MPVDVERLVDRGLQTISKNLEREVAKNKLTPEQRDQSLARITCMIFYCGTIEAIPGLGWERVCGRADGEHVEDSLPVV